MLPVLFLQSKHTTSIPSCFFLILKLGISNNRIHTETSSFLWVYTYSASFFFSSSLEAWLIKMRSSLGIFLRIPIWRSSKSGSFTFTTSSNSIWLMRNWRLASDSTSSCSGLNPSSQISGASQMSLLRFRDCLFPLTCSWISPAWSLADWTRFAMRLGLSLPPLRLLICFGLQWAAICSRSGPHWTESRSQQWDLKKDLRVSEHCY